MKDRKKIKDLTGKKFGMLTVIGLQDTNSRKTYWVCQCDCGNIKVALTVCKVALFVHAAA